MKTVTRLAGCNCFAARQAARHLTKLYERHLSGVGLTSAQFSILVAVDEAEEITMAELASALVMDRTTLLRALKPLQREELLRSRPSADDARLLVYALSAAGERRLEQAMPLWSKAQSELEAQVGAGAAARMRRDLLALSKPA